MRKTTIILSSLLAILLTVGIVWATNTFPTTLNDWEEGDVIEEGWANALEDKIGVDSSSVTSSLDYLVKTHSQPTQLTVSGTTTLNDSFTGYLRADSGLISTTTAVTTESDPIWIAASSSYYQIASDSYVYNIGDTITGALTIQGTSTLATTTITYLTLTTDLDVSDDINLTAGDYITLTDDDLDIDVEVITDTKCLWFEDPTAADDFKSIWRSSIAITFTKIWAESDQTVTFNLQEDDGSPGNILSSNLAPAAGTASSTSFADAAFAADSRLDLVVDSVASTPTWVSICWTYTKND